VNGGGASGRLEGQAVCTFLLPSAKRLHSAVYPMCKANSLLFRAPDCLFRVVFFPPPAFIITDGTATVAAFCRDAPSGFQVRRRIDVRGGLCVRLDPHALVRARPREKEGSVATRSAAGRGGRSESTERAP
jgi:hypothetical protein